MRVDKNMLVVSTYASILSDKKSTIRMNPPATLSSTKQGRSWESDQPVQPMSWLTFMLKDSFVMKHAYA